MSKQLRNFALIGLMCMTLALIALIPLVFRANESQPQPQTGRSSAQPARLLTTNSLIWPISGSSAPDTDLISSPFGPRWQASQSRYDYHSGIDIASPQGTAVHVISDGIVTRQGWLSSNSGLAVFVYHPDLNLYSVYIHLSTIAVSTNDSVTQGQVIGEVGDTGATEFMHLHFEIRLTDIGWPTNTRNPIDYLPHPDLSAPTISIVSITSNPVYNPTVSLFITAPRAELDVNKIRVQLYDRATGSLLDDQFVNFNQRLHTGGDTLDQDGIQLLPFRFNTSTSQYQLTANFYNLSGRDTFIMTAQVEDLAGNMNTVTAFVDDLTPPAKVTDLSVIPRSDGSVELSWTAPGDSGFVGQAAAYDIRTSSEPINAIVWDNNTTPLNSPPIPFTGGTHQNWIVPGPFTSPVYFALRATDSEGNLSVLSNSAGPVRPPSADLEISKIDDTDPLETGNQLTYSLTVLNNGPDSAENISIIDTLPAGVSFISVSPGSPICTETGRTVTCGLGTLASGAGANVTIVVDVDPNTSGTITNLATVSSTLADPDIFNNNTGEDTVVTVPSKDDTITSLASSQNPSTYGQVVTFTATTAPDSASGTLTGSVTFKEGTTVLGRDILDGTGKAIFTTSTLSAATHPITALYSGDGDFNASSETFNQIVDKADTTTTVTSSANPATDGQAVTFNAIVTAIAPGTTTPSGTVSFKSGVTVIATTILDGAGQVTYTTSNLPVGTHPITAEYSGNLDYNSSFVSLVPDQVINEQFFIAIPFALR